MTTAAPPHTSGPVAWLPALHPAGTGRWRAHVDRSWWSWSGPHGGLLAALAVRASAAVVPGEHAVQTVSTQFLAAAGEGELELVPEVLRAGRSSAVVAVSVRSAGQVCAVSTVTWARPRPGGTQHQGVPAPAAPPPELCDVVEVPVELVPFTQHLRVRAVAGSPVTGGPVPELVAWLQLVDAPAVLDAALLVLLTDALPPGLYGVATVPVPVPSHDLSVTLTAGSPPSGWVLCRITTRWAQDGWCVDDADVWDAGGVLLAQARQTRRVLGEVRP